MQPTSKTRAAHTPGPWEFDHCTEHRQKDDPGYFQIDGPIPVGLNATIPYTVADTMNRNYCISPEEDAANARLIAAAPALLAEAIELLKNARYQDGQAIVLTQDCEALEAAIQKARGGQ